MKGHWDRGAISNSGRQWFRTKPKDRSPRVVCAQSGATRRNEAQFCRVNLSAASLFVKAPSISTELIAIPDGGGVPFYNAYLTCRYRIPYVPLSNPFVERLVVGTLRRECRDRTLFWT